MQDPSASELLDIREAAEFLRVSETSLRRWTNAGRLPCLRIGGRQERRFRRSDLLALLGLEPTTLAARSHSHFCAFYTSDLTRARQAAAVLASGLRSRSLCLLLCANEVQRTLLELLGREHPSIHKEIEAGRILLNEYLDSATAQLEYLDSWLRTTFAAGVARVVAVGDVSAGMLGGLPFAELLEYEVEYGRSVAGRFPVTTLCQYDARELSGVQAAQLLEHHDS